MELEVALDDELCNYNCLLSGRGRAALDDKYIVYLTSGRGRAAGGHGCFTTYNYVDTDV